MDSPHTQTTNSMKKKTSKVSRKVTITQKKSMFLKGLLKELKIRQEHTMRCHSQYKAFKQARVDVQNDSEVATVQINWSENVKMKQAREEKKAYYDEVQISVHAMYV